jgi:hypothetical protein
MTDLWHDQWRSYRSLPSWVQVWVAWLVVVNLIGAADRSTPTGRETRRATWVFLPVNTALVILQRGYSGALSFSHLVAWPLLVLRGLRSTRTPCRNARRSHERSVAGVRSPGRQPLDRRPPRHRGCPTGRHCRALLRIAV